MKHIDFFKNKYLDKKYGNQKIIEIWIDAKKKMVFCKALCDCGVVKTGRVYDVIQTKSCKFHQHLDLVGKRFSKLTVISLNKIEVEKCTNKRAAFWECKCDCGKTIVVTSARLMNKDATSCGNHRWKGYGEISGGYWANVKYGASSRNISFQITMQQAWEIFLKQKGLCALTGQKIVFVRDWNIRNIQTASLDRIDSKGNYSVDNIQWVHKDINLMKGPLSVNEFIDWCKRISNFCKKCNFRVKKFSNEKRKKEKINISKRKRKIYKDISLSMLTRIKREAKAREIDFNITEIDIWNTYIKQNKRCRFTGVSIYFSPFFEKYPILQTASIDRIDSKKGYFPNNIQIVHKKINHMKLIFPDEYFIELCYNIVNFTRKKD